MLEKWKKRALRFIWTQRVEELDKAIRRYPNSDRYQDRVNEHADLKAKLAELEND